MVIDDDVGSFVQIRGSIPLFWQQNINIRYKPPFSFYNKDRMGQVFDQHFDRLRDQYGQVTAVNLVDQRGWEGELAREFAKRVKEYGKSDMHYEAFDFHAMCPRMSWHRVSILMDRLEQDLKSQGYFIGHLDTAQNELRLTVEKVKGQQSGVIRTNCIDCLDRTNLVQGSIGRRILILQLHQMGVLTEDDKIADYPALEALFKQGNLVMVVELMLQSGRIMAMQSVDNIQEQVH